MLDPYDDWLKKAFSKPATPDLIEGLLPDANEFVVLAGRAGIGKTNWALMLACSFATGTDFLGFKVQKVPVGYIGFEGAESKMAERLIKIRAIYPVIEHGMFHFGLPKPFRLDGANIDKLKTMVKECHVVIVDPLKYLVAGDYTKTTDAVRFLENLKVVMNDTGTSFILCHHIRKSNPNSLIEPGDLDQIKGAGDYCDAASTVLLLERERQGHKSGGGFAPMNPDLAVLYFAKTRDARNALDPMSLRFDRQALLWKKC